MADLQEALFTMALLIKKEQGFYEKRIKPLEDLSLNSATYREFEHIRASRIEFGNRLAADPNFYDIIESWIIAVIGKEGISKETVDRAYNEKDYAKALEHSGTLAVSVRDFLKENGYIFCNVGAGEDGWDISVRCTEKKARELCSLIRERFHQALRLDLLHLSKRFGGHYLPGLYSLQDAERILRSYGSADIEF
jgi:hypothetical protein